MNSLILIAAKLSAIIPQNPPDEKRVFPDVLFVVFSPELWYDLSYISLSFQARIQDKECVKKSEEFDDENHIRWYGRR